MIVPISKGLIPSTATSPGRSSHTCGSLPDQAGHAKLNLRGVLSMLGSTEEAQVVWRENASTTSVCCPSRLAAEGTSPLRSIWPAGCAGSARLLTTPEGHDPCTAAGHASARQDQRRSQLACAVGGLLHSFEMPSELAEVLETPTAVAGVVEALTLSALGATGRMEASFASGNELRRGRGTRPTG